MQNDVRIIDPHFSDGSMLASQDVYTHTSQAIPSLLHFLSILTACTDVP